MPRKPKTPAIPGTGSYSKPLQGPVLSHEDKEFNEKLGALSDDQISKLVQGLSSLRAVSGPKSGR